MRRSSLAISWNAKSGARRVVKQACRVSVESLEQRALLTVGGAAGYTVTLTDRSYLLQALKGGTLKNDLNTILNVNSYPTQQDRFDAYDSRLRSFMINRSSATTPTYFFEQSEGGALMADAAGTNYVAESRGRTTGVNGNVNASLVGDTQEQQGFRWAKLAFAYRYVRQNGTFTGSLPSATNYSDELMRRLGIWATQTTKPASTGPTDYLTNDPTTGTSSWGTINSFKRLTEWSTAYYMLLNTPALTPEANTLFLTMMFRHGHYANTLNEGGGSYSGLRNNVPNQRATRSANLMVAARVFTLFNDATVDTSTPSWITRANAWFGEDFSTSAASTSLRQFRPDGGHVEQSPNYAAVVIREYASVAQLEKVLGLSWVTNRPTAYNQLKLAGDRFYGYLSPDGSIPALGDSYRTAESPTLSELAYALDVDLATNWVAAKPTLDNLIYSYHSQGEFDAGAPLNPVPGRNRGIGENQRDSGYYIIRSTEDADPSKDRQLVFDVGPFGSSSSSGHGHYDLLNFELYGNGRPLVVDPGDVRAVATSQRPQNRSTPMHNTISVDGYNHGVYADYLGGVYDKQIVSIKSTNDGSVSGLEIKGRHNNYQSLGAVVARTIWFDQKDTFIVVDWGANSTARNFQVSYNLNDPTLVSGLTANGTTYRTDNSTTANLFLQVLNRSGQAVTTAAGNTVSSSASVTTQRVVASQAATTNPIFVSVMTTYGSTVPSSRVASIISAAAGGNVTVQYVTAGGATKQVTLSPLSLATLTTDPVTGRTPPAAAPVPSSLRLADKGPRSLFGELEIDERKDRAGLLPSLV